MRPRLALLVLTVLAVAACSGGDDDDASPGPSGTATVSTHATAKELPVDGTVTLYAADAADTGSALAAGDFNGDGAMDVLYAAAFGDGPNNERADAGEAYVFLGPFERGETRDAAKGEQDLTVYGADPGDQLGRAAAAGDVNGDGIDDIILGAPFADGPAGERTDAGEVYIVYGSGALGADVSAIDLRDGAPLTVYGATAGDLAGFAVAAARLNADAADDLIIGAFWAGGPGDERTHAGEVYAVFGGPDRSSAVDIAGGQQDVTVYGAAADDRLGEGVAAGDVNGDGVDDLVLPAPFATSLAGQPAAGRTYVIYSPPPPSTDLAGDKVDAVIYGMDDGDQLGHVTAAGDVDGDGWDDILLTAVSADGPGNTVDLAGEAVLVLAKSIAAEVDVADGGGDTVIYGADKEDRLGRSAALGDLDGDGRKDLLLGAPGGAGPREATATAGEVYVVAGREVQATVELPEGALVYYGTEAGDNLASEIFGRLPLQTADMDGDGREEILAAAATADGPGGGRKDCGKALVIFVSKGAGE